MARGRPAIGSLAPLDRGRWSSRRTAWWLAVGLAIVGLTRAAGAGINVWTRTGPYGGDIAALAVAPSDPTVLYASVAGALFKSTDAGASWSSVVYNSAYYTPITVIAIDPRTPSTVYVGGGYAYGEGSLGFVLRSTDAGRTWVSTLDDPYDADPIVALAIDPKTPTTLYAGGSGVFKSTNSAATWNRANAGLDQGVSALAIDPTAPTTLYAAATGEVLGSGGGVFRSTDGGASWNATGDGLPTDWVVSAFVVDPLTPTTLYAATDGGGVFKSTDGGDSWSAVNDGLSNPAVRALVLDPAQSTTLYAGTSGGAVFRSADGGTTWHVVSDGLTFTHVAALAVDPTAPSTLYAGTSGGGIFKSTTAGEGWSAVNTGLPPLASDHLAAAATSPGTLYAACGTGVFKSTDAGATWNAASAGLGNAPVSALAVEPGLPDTLYAAQAYCGQRGCIHAGMFRSRDGGNSWQAIATGLDLPFRSIVTSLAIAPTGSRTLYATAGPAGVLESADGGDTWAPINAGLPSDAYVGILAIDPATPATLYAGTSGDGMYRSTDGGASWMEINNGLTDPYIRELAIDPSRPLTLYVGSDSGLFRSTDGGADWAAVDLAGYYAGALAVDATDTIYATSHLAGVARSGDGGDSWRTLATGLGAPDVGYLAVSSFALDPASNNLFAATASGVFVIDQVSACAGDCNVDDDVAIAELLTLVNIGLGDSSVVDCGSGDTDGDGRITIDEIVEAVNVALDGCAVAKEQP